MNAVREWLVPLLSFGVFALCLLAYVVLYLAGADRGTGPLMTLTQTALGATLGTGAMASRARR